MAKVQYDFNPAQINGDQSAPEAPEPEVTPEAPTQPEPAVPEETPEVAPAEAPADAPPKPEEVKVPEVKPEAKPEPVKEEAPAPAKRAVDEDTQKFLDYQERTGRGIKDYQELNRDVSKMDPLEAARDRVRKENEGADLTPQDINYLLEDELGFDPTDEDLSDQEKAKFKKFYGNHLSNLKKEQQKYNEPAEDFVAAEAENSSQPDGGKKVQLSNGQEVDEAEYAEERRKYLEARDAALQTLGEEAFKLTYDGKDGKKELSFDYKYTDEDLHSMKSITEDVGGILSNYQKEDGFDHGSFNKDLLWTNSEFRSKAISALLSRARNEVISEMTANRKNLNFDSPNTPPKTAKAGYAEPGSEGKNSGPSVRYNLP